LKIWPNYLTSATRESFILSEKVDNYADAYLAAFCSCHRVS
jgi:hypothetical protein